MTTERKSFIIGNVRRANHLNTDERRNAMDEKKKEALQELLKILADCPEVAERITITIKPNSKPKQGEHQT